MQELKLKEILEPHFTNNDINIIDKILEYLKICERCNKIYDPRDDEHWKDLCRHCIVEYKIESTIDDFVAVKISCFDLNDENNLNDENDEILNIFIDEIYYLDIENKELFEEKLREVLSYFIYAQLDSIKIEDFIDMIKKLACIDEIN